MTAAEKYAEVGDSRPRCECHGELMYWKKNLQCAGLGTWTCKVKNADEDRAYYLRNQTTILGRQSARIAQNRKTLKLEHGGACVRCGYDRCLAALHFHHRDSSEKEFDVGTLVARTSLERARIEAEKCDLLCANCHAELHEEHKLASA